MTIEELLINSALYGVGALLGVSTLPWKEEIAPKNSTLGYLLGAALLWPFYVLVGLLLAASTYRDAWTRYLDGRQLERYRRQEAAKSPRSDHSS